MVEKGRQVRKLAAIMFTDMVGYSALTQKNELLAIQMLEEHHGILRPLFPKYDGREIETVGDAFFVEFSSALEAVRCAVVMQESLFKRNSDNPDKERIRIRIGIHPGDVVYHGEKQLKNIQMPVAIYAVLMVEHRSFSISHSCYASRHMSLLTELRRAHYR